MVRTWCFHCHGSGVNPGRELRSHKPFGVAKNNNKNKIKYSLELGSGRGRHRWAPPGQLKEWRASEILYHCPSPRFGPASGGDPGSSPSSSSPRACPQSFQSRSANPDSWQRQLVELNKNPVEGFSAGLIDDYDLYQRRRQWHPTPVLLAGKSHGWRSLVGRSPWSR